MVSEQENEINKVKQTQHIPAIPAFSTNYMDFNADPRTDFYTYSAGNWIRDNSIPEDKSTWGAFDELLERNNYLLKRILEDCSSGEIDQRLAGGKMLGDFYKSAMNTDIIERLKFEPINDLLEKVDRINSVDNLFQIVSDLHSKGIYPLFFSYSEPDKKNSTIYALYIDQGGLSLPDKEYYLSENFKEILDQYEQHIKKMFGLRGSNESEAERYAKSIIEVETEIARYSRSQTELRDAEKNYNRFEISEIDANFPGIPLKLYLDLIGMPAVDYVVLGQPEFILALQKLLHIVPIEKWKIYLHWNILNSSASFLHSIIEQEHFDFFNRKLLGQPKPEPRWKIAINVIDSHIGEALGELYVKDHFGEEAKKRMGEMISDISEVFKEKITKLTWMSEETKKLAMIKFDRFRSKIGYPERFRDYSSIVVRDYDYFGNVQRSSIFEINRRIRRVGTPVDKNEWYMTPPTVNAYFSPTDNEIVFPAGILQPPFFDVSADDAVNYGAIGGVISHEITHGYDDQGRKYDANGNLNDWWKQEDQDEFLKRAQSVVELYGSLEVIPGLRVNGQLTLGENIADFGGVSIAFEALQRRLKKHPELRKDIDGLSSEQRFFISWAQVWRLKIREPEVRRRIVIDPHSPDRFRATLPVTNHQGFEKAFPEPNSAYSDVSVSKKIAIW